MEFQYLWSVELIEHGSELKIFCDPEHVIITHQKCI